VKARQRVQLTGTNRSFDLIALVAKATLLGSEHENALNKNRASARAGFALAHPSGAGGAPPHRKASFASPFFAGLVALARRSDPIPSRTRPSNALAPMVLCLKTWESRSSPGLQRTEIKTTEDRPTDRRLVRPTLPLHQQCVARKIAGSRMTKYRGALSARPRSGPIRPPSSALPSPLDAGWSSPVARQAHNLKAAGSNPAPATKPPKRTTLQRAPFPHSEKP